MSAPYIAIITPLRGLGALWVFLFHLKFQLPQLDRLINDNTYFLERSYVWLDFFFILSGYVLTHVYGQRLIEGVTRARYRAFIVARFGRIYPLHFATLMGMLLVHGSLLLFADVPFFREPFFTPESIGTNLLLIQSLNIHPQPTWNIPAWSISTEWWAYMLFPLFIPRLLRHTRVVAACVAAAAWMALMVLYATHDSLNINVQDGIFRCVFEFVIGCCIYRLKDSAALDWLARDGAMTALFAAIVVSMHFPPYPGDDPMVVGLLALLIVAATRNRGAWRGLFERKLSLFLGEVSYSIYLVHFPIMQFGHRAIDELAGVYRYGEYLSTAESILVAFAYLLVVLAASYLSYHYIEDPCRRYIRRWQTSGSA